MATDHDEGSFDIILLGTGLTESITAAALAKAGFKIAHLDSQNFYGGAQASLALDELVQWAKANGHIFHIRDSLSDIPSSRQYSVSLFPSVIPSVGPLISSLVASGVARYGGFKLLDKVAIYRPDSSLKNVPTSKEDIFNDPDISLLDKRRLMKFLTFCMSEGSLEDSPQVQGNENKPFLDFLRSSFSLNNEIASAVTYALAFCATPFDPTLAALLRIQNYLRSVGRYGPSPFLLGHYGSLGEIAQGFCRAAAVNGAVYILGHSLTSLKIPTINTSKRKFSLTITDFEETMEADLIISSDISLISKFLDSSELPKLSSAPVVFSAQCIAIIDSPITFPRSTITPSSEDTTDNEVPVSDPQPDTFILAFPPGSVPLGSSNLAATALITGQGSMSAPAGSSIIYITFPLIESLAEIDVEELMQPYLTHILATLCPENTTPLLRVFYLHKTIANSNDPNTTGNVLLCPELTGHPLPLPGDEAARNAENLFREAVKVLRNTDDPIADFWPPLGDPEMDDD